LVPVSGKEGKKKSDLSNNHQRGRGGELKWGESLHMPRTLLPETEILEVADITRSNRGKSGQKKKRQRGPGNWDGETLKGENQVGEFLAKSASRRSGPSRKGKAG